MSKLIRGKNIAFKRLEMLLGFKTEIKVKSHQRILLAKLQWKNRNKVIGSNNWKKAQLKIAKLHYKISCIRQDFIHKLTTRLAKNHSEIVIENLNVAGMIKNRKLAKAIADSGFFEFKRQLTYKTQLYGSELVLADRFFPSSKLCPCCGNKKEQLPLSMRVYDCENCDWVADRDYSASLNLLGLVRPDVMPVETKTPKSVDEAGTEVASIGMSG